MTGRLSKGDVLGVALSPISITASAAAAPTLWQRDLDVHGGANGSRELLTAAFADAVRASGMDAPNLVVVLMPPLEETRTITLPPLAEDDRNRFLAKHAGRYFVAARGPQVVASAATAGQQSRSESVGPSPVLATAAAQQLTQSVHAASLAVGLALQAVIPAESAWAAAAVALWPVFVRGTAHVIVARDDRTDLLTLRDGVMRGVRRFRGIGDIARIASIVTFEGERSSARIAVVGPPGAAHAMTNALTGTGLRVLAPEAKWAAFAEQPDALAARFAANADGLEFRSEASVERDRADVRRQAWWALGAAAAVLLLAAFTYYGGVRRELSSVQAGRSAIRAQVEATLVGRSSVDVAYRQVAGLATTARTSRRWSEVLAALSAHLPLDASLTAVRVRGDSVFIDGVAERAAPVFDAIARMPGVASVRATAPVRRDAIEGELPLEHFSLGAQLIGVAPTRAASALPTAPSPSGVKR